MLYRPESFETLADERWDNTRVRVQVREIAEDADRTFDFNRLWPVDERDAGIARLPLTNLYLGAAGVLWALNVLRRRGLAEGQIDLERAALRTLEAWRAGPDFLSRDKVPAGSEASLWMGEAGILLVAWQLSPNDELAKRLHSRVRANCSSQTNELMWGASGTMLAARAMLEWTRELRWANVWHVSAEELWRRRELGGLWTQHLDGNTGRILGPIHGAVGNTVALLQGSNLPLPERQGGTLLAPERQEELERETSEALGRTAVVEGALANWPRAEGQDLVEKDGEIRVQWCHGAPGILASAATYLDEELLLRGAELVWRAGGQKKGPGLCHGTAGNGYALLKVFGRTGDELWLERARRFALHALRQVERSRIQQRCGRYSLWTGDVGAALFAADCLDCRTAVPIIDYWDA